MTRALKVFPSAAGLARGAANQIVTILRDARRAGAPSSLVLSGGSTPRAVYQLLATDEFRSRVEWLHLHLFWGDERCVPPTSPESNYRMVRETLLESVPVPAGHIHRIHGELPPAQAAIAYEDELRAVFGTERGALPRPDLVLLGLGEDGHTASLFPGTAVLQEERRLVADVYVDRLNASRVTLTFPVLNNARAVLFLVSGPSKAAALAAVLRNPASGSPASGLPASRLLPRDGDLFWYVDHDAAAQLSLSETL
ncbi:MAG TPA: 6-phosphogluconolactonase [Bacteroidota bacterium]